MAQRSGKAEAIRTHGWGVPAHTRYERRAHPIPGWTTRGLARTHARARAGEIMPVEVVQAPVPPVEFAFREMSALPNASSLPCEKCPCWPVQKGTRIRFSRRSGGIFTLPQVDSTQEQHLCARF